MANTGNVIYTKLVKVSDDGNNTPLDEHNIPISLSGLPQDSKDNIYGQPDYVEPEYNIERCELPPPSTLMFTTSYVGLGFTFTAVTSSNIVITAKRPDSTVISQFTGASSTKTLNLTSSGGVAQIYLEGDINAITSLHIEGRVITSTSFGEMVNLETLQLINCGINNIILTNNVNLKTLNLAQNSLSSINLTGLNLIEELTLNNNVLTSINVSNLVNLKILVLNNNNLSALNVTTNILLTNLQFGVNNISTINVTNLSNLTTLQASGASLTSINLSNNILLNYLNLFGNNLTTINLSANINLDSIYLAGNNLSTVSFANNTLATLITIGDNGDISTVDISMLPLLSYFDCQNLVDLLVLNINSNNNLINLRCGGAGFATSIATSTQIDNIIIKMDANITADMPEKSLHYITLDMSGGVQPSVAARPAYLSLQAKGTDLLGNPPLTA